MELIMQSFMPYFLATLGIGSGISLSIFVLGGVALFFDKKLPRIRR